MSLRANPTVIGLFVIGAAVLGVVAVLVFGSGKLFHPQEQFIIYFADSVNGLTEGSPVKFKGVQIGSVKTIMIRYDQPPDDSHIPVIIEIDTVRLHKSLGVEADLGDEQVFDQQIRDGLRAKLQMQSFLTGMLYVDLDYYTGLTEPRGIEQTPTYKEIPSMPSGMSEIMKSVTLALQNIGQIDFKGINDKVSMLLDQLNTGVGQINFKEINDSLVAATNSLNTLLSDPKLRETIAQLDSTLGSFQKLSDNVNDQVQPLSNEIQLTAQRARVTLDQVDATLKALRELVEPDSSLRYELDRTMAEIAGAARSLRVLADFLERNPSSLIFGKGAPQVQTFGNTTTGTAGSSDSPDNASSRPPAVTGGNARQ